MDLQLSSVLPLSRINGACIELLEYCQPVVSSSVLTTKNQSGSMQGSWLTEIGMDFGAGATVLLLFGTGTRPATFTTA